MITKGELQELLNLKCTEYTKTPIYDDDNIRFKEIIKQRLMGNNSLGSDTDKARTLANSHKLLHILNTPNCDEGEPDDYYGISILPYYIIADTQTDVQNFVCFETSYDTYLQGMEGVVRRAQIIFYILCDVRSNNNIDRETGIARHDLLAHIITNEFNGTNCFGMQFSIVSDKPSTVDNNYAARIINLAGNTISSIRDNNRITSGTVRR